MTGLSLAVLAVASNTVFDGATITGVEEFRVATGSGNDSLVGGAFADSLVGGSGNDSLNGGAGNDTLAGGDGADTLVAGTGDDDLDGGTGIDLAVIDRSAIGGNIVFARLLGGAQADRVESRDGSFTTFVTDAERFNVTTGTGNDRIVGDALADTLSGGAGNDTITTGTGADSVNGGSGTDRVLIDHSGASDALTLTVLGVASNTLFDGATITGVEEFQVFSGSGNDTMTGGTAGDTLAGFGGDDSLSGGNGSDVLDGGDGSDTLVSGTGDDSLFGGDGIDLAVIDRGAIAANIVFANLFGGAPANRAESRDGSFTTFVTDAERFDVRTGSGNDRIDGDALDDTLSGGSGNDTLNGGDGADSLSGGNSTDSLVGGLGNDTFIGGSGVDTAVVDGAWTDYFITRNGAGNLILARVGDTDEVRSDVEILQFGTGGAALVVDMRTPPAGIGPDVVLSTNGPTLAAPVETGPDEDGNAATLAVNENVAIGTVIGTVSASDLNLPLGDVLSFSLSGAPGPFELVKVSDTMAEIRVAGLVDFEGGGASQAIQMRVTDLAGNFMHGFVSIGVLDLPEAPAIHTTGLTVAENAQAVGSLAGDGFGNPITWSLEAGGADNALFAIDAATGAVTFIAAAGGDFEADASFEILVGATTSGGFDSQTVTITLTDVNEAPTLTTPSFTIAENQQSVGTLAATDPDAVPSIRFSLVAGQGDNALFTVNAITGALAFASAGGGDFETDASFSLLVRVADAGDPDLFTESTVTVTLTDVAEAPVISTTALTVAENVQAVGTVAGDGLGNAITWTLEPGGADNALFAINAATGALTFIAAAGGNFEADATLQVAVRATTSGGFDTQTVAVTLTDVNEAPRLTTAGFTIAENQQAVGTLAATDPDAVASIRFSLVAGQGDNALFTVNAITGALAFASATGGDFETDAVLDLVIRTADAGTPALFTDRSITVTLTDLVETFNGTAGNDLLAGNSGIDRLNGLGGNDTLLASAGADTLDGSTGTDTVRFSSQVRLDRANGANSTGEAAGDTYVSIEVFEAAAGNDSMRGAGLNDRFLGGAGNDTLDGGNGNDTLEGGTGRDTLIGGAGNDSLLGGVGADSIVGGDGADTFIGGAGIDTLVSSADGARDVFRFATLADGGDTIQGYVSTQDVIEFSRVGFGLDDSASIAGLLVIGTGAAAPAGSEYAILYDATTGLLSADVNGSDAGGTFLLASFGAGKVLVAADFALIA